ncbi:hypothetical protein [Streptomyces sp. NPDC018045]|uniref:hypothetical protein n=1 Tax=Streptomyces sp. NPDC018045 TaxID=3365037 RepID=UPI00378DC9D3
MPPRSEAHPAAVPRATPVPESFSYALAPSGACRAPVPARGRSHFSLAIGLFLAA